MAAPIRGETAEILYGNISVRFRSPLPRRTKIDHKHEGWQEWIRNGAEAAHALAAALDLVVEQMKEGHIIRANASKPTREEHRDDERHTPKPSANWRPIFAIARGWARLPRSGC